MVYVDSRLSKAISKVISPENSRLAKTIVVPITVKASENYSLDEKAKEENF